MQGKIEPSSYSNRTGSLSFWYLGVLGGTLFLGALGLSFIQHQLKNDQRKTLTTAVHSARTALLQDYAQSKAVALSWSKVPRIRSELLSLFESNGRGRVNDHYSDTSREILREQLSPTVKSHGYLGFVAVDSNGDELVSDLSFRKIPTDFFRRKDFLKRILGGEVVVSHPYGAHINKLESSNGSDTSSIILVGAPVRDSHNTIFGALCFIIDPGSLFSASLGSEQLGKSGETYIFDDSGMMLSESRFEQQLQMLGLLNKYGESAGEGRVPLVDPGRDLSLENSQKTRGEVLALTAMAQHAIQGGDGVNTDGYRDYRGVEVIGAWEWIPEESLGIATEIDKDEADLSLYRVVAVFWIAFVLLFTVLTFGLVLFYRYRIQARKLAETAKASKSAVIAKGYFLANVSHELRTPLTAILGFAEVAKERDVGSREQDLALDTILSNAHHLLGLVNDILDFSKMEFGQLGIEQVRFSPTDLVQEIHSILNAKASEKGLQLRLKFRDELPKQILSDPLRLKQILLNLLSNAIKFTESGSVSTEVWCDWEGSLVHFKISDSGIGMSSDHLSRLFKPFTQADLTTTRKYGGTGLGLSISKELVEMLGGSIEVESTPGQGSSFSFSIAAGPVDRSQSIRLDKKKTAHRRVSMTGDVLVAEDAIDISGLINILLKKVGLNVTIVDNGFSAVELALSNSYDLILLDMQMPIMDGYTAAKVMRERGLTAPIVAVSANVGPQDYDICRAAGCTALLPKPFTQEELITCIAAFFEKNMKMDQGSFAR